MLTNISHKPVVTWKDLRNGFGYRLPYGIDNKVNDYETSFLLKGVTYNDLENCEKGYISEYKSQFDQLTDAQKRMYITNKATLSTFVYPISSFSLTPASNVGYYTTSVGYTGGTQFRFIADPMSERKDIVWFTFTADQSMPNCSVTWDKLSLVATYTNAGSTNASITLQGQIIVRKAGTLLTIGRGMISTKNISVNSTYEPINVQMPTNFTAVQKGATYEVVLSVYTSVFYKSEADIPSITAELPLKPITPGITLTNITFYSKDATLSLESNNKCVTYDLVKANTNVTVPVYVYIKNHLVVVTYATSVNFYYRYSLVGSPSVYNTIWTGGGALCSSLGRKDAVSKIYNINLNPKVSGEVANDQLLVTFGDTNTPKLLGVTYVEDGVSKSWGSASATKLYCYYPHKEFSGKWYRSTMEKLTEIHGRINGD